MGSRIARMMIMSAATSGCLAQTMAMQSAQLAQKAGRLVRTASLNPKPPRDNGIVATSWRSPCCTNMSTKPRTISGLTAQHVVARPPAQCKRRAHADWTFSTNGMRDKRTSCLCSDSSQEGLDVMGMSQWSAQNADPLFFCGHSRSPPHPRLWV